MTVPASEGYDSRVPRAERPRNALSHANAMAPAALALFVAGQLCLARLTSPVDGLLIALLTVLALALVTDRRGGKFLLEAVTVAFAQFALHHGLAASSGGQVAPASGPFVIDWHLDDVLLVSGRIAVTVLVVLTLRLIERGLRRFVPQLAPRMICLLFGVRQRVSFLTRFVRALEDRSRTMYRRGPPRREPVRYTVLT